jgi:hypothetical protein
LRHLEEDLEDVEDLVERCPENLRLEDLTVTYRLKD